MDSPYLRRRLLLFGVAPLRSSEFALEGRRLAVERRVVPFVPQSDYVGCLLFFLPLPLNTILGGVRSSKDPPSHVTEWVLCLRGVDHGTEDLAQLKHAQVAASFLGAAEEIQPEHVELE